MEPVCKICLQQFNVDDKVPRICSKCGRSICDKCISDIFRSKKAYQCPFCKAAPEEKWPKNLQLLEGLEHQGLLCIDHKRKVLTLCSSEVCKLPVGICDLTQCSTKHKQKGTNVLPLSLLNQPLKQKIKNQQFSNIIEGFNVHLKLKMADLFSQLQLKAQQANKKGSQIKLSKQANDTINKIVNKKVDSLTSQNICSLKKEIINIDDEQQEKKSLEVVFKQFKLKLIKQMIDTIQNIQLTDFNRIDRSKLKQMKGQEIMIKNMQRPNIQRPILLTDDKVFQMIFKQLGKPLPRINLLFHSKQHAAGQFKQIVGGKFNLIYFVELEDGNIFGAYMSKQYPTGIKKDIQMHDPKAFVWWYNWHQIFRAHPDKKSIQFDFSVEFNLSVGNTANFDGFWFKGNSFDNINPSAGINTIWSQMFEGLKIDSTTRKVVRFRTFNF